MDELSNVLTRSFLDLCKDKLQYRAWFKVKGSLEVNLDGEHVLLLNICETIISDCQINSSRAKETNFRNSESCAVVNTVLQGTASEVPSWKTKQEAAFEAEGDADVLTDADKLSQDTLDVTESTELRTSKKLDGTPSCTHTPYFTLLTVPVRKPFGVVDGLTGSHNLQTENLQSSSLPRDPSSVVTTNANSDLPETCILTQDNNDNSLIEPSSVLHAPNDSQAASCQSSDKTNSEVCLRHSDQSKIAPAKKKSAYSFAEKQKWKAVDSLDIEIKKELLDSDHCEDIESFDDKGFIANNITGIKSEAAVTERCDAPDATAVHAETGGQFLHVSVSNGEEQRSAPCVTLTHTSNKGATVETCKKSKSNKKNYICSMCGKVFKRIATYKKHIQSPHSKNKKRQRKKTSMDRDKKSSTMENFDQYVHGESPGGKKYYKCPNCIKQFVQLKRFKKHIKDHHAAQEQEELKEKNKDVDPLSIVSPERNNRSTYKCPTCGREFRNLESFEKHMKRPHGKKKHTCEECGKGFDDKGNYSKHMRSHTGERPYKCEFCVKTFKYVGSLQIHKRLHTGEKPWKCGICDKTFIRSDGLTSHMRVHTERERVHACSVCNKAFTSKHILKQHFRIHTDDDRYKCDICGIRVTNVASHKLTHTGEKNYICTVCGRGFSQFGSLKSHQRTHTGEKPYPCPQCDLKFARKGSLTTHLKLHSGEKNFVCSTCGKAFSQSSSLKYHIRVHEGIKPHVCSVCNKAYVDPCNLRVHMRIHTGEKPYICEFCGKAFNQSISLKIHRRIHTGEKPYTCDLCGATFSQLAGLKSHKLTHQADRQIDKT